VRIRLWYLLRKDLKEDQSTAEWVCFQRSSAWRTIDLLCLHQKRSPGSLDLRGQVVVVLASNVEKAFGIVDVFLHSLFPHSTCKTSVTTDTSRLPSVNA